ncbi:MAG: di-heme oxidoredictase family protein [Bryobacteraceae bacterium]|nr:di-heme oxidoredictase family protein [Bryobacteraceae bacterium]
MTFNHLFIAIVLFGVLGIPSSAQLIDQTKAPNAAKEGIAKSFTQQVGAGRGNVMTPDSSAFIIARDPYRAIRRGRQIFQRKFNRQDGDGPYVRDGSGDIANNIGIGAGSADSCAACHGRPRGSAGVGGDVVTRPDSRDAPHLFGLGLKEMLADEITAELRARRDKAVADARATKEPVTAPLTSKGISYGLVVAMPDGKVDLSQVEGVSTDLRVRPFFAHGGTVSIREFVNGALNNEMGLQAIDPEVTAASAGQSVLTPAGMFLDGKMDTIEVPPDPDPSRVAAGQPPRNSVNTAIVDYLEFYLLNYFKPGLYEQTERVVAGRGHFMRAGCGGCHIPDLRIDRDRRVADVETVYDPRNGILNSLFATATPLVRNVEDGSGFPPLRNPLLQPFLVRNIFTDFKRHDLGPGFHERNYDGSMENMLMTTPLWGVGSTSPYGHDGRSINLNEAILRHGGEAQTSRDLYAAMPSAARSDLQEFLNSLVLFPPDDTASNLDAGDRTATGFPQLRHGALKLTVLFNDPRDIE